MQIFTLIYLKNKHYKKLLVSVSRMLKQTKMKTLHAFLQQNPAFCGCRLVVHPAAAPPGCRHRTTHTHFQAVLFLQSLQLRRHMLALLLVGCLLLVVEVVVSYLRSFEAQIAKIHQGGVQHAPPETADGSLVSVL